MRYFLLCLILLGGTVAASGQIQLGLRAGIGTIFLEDESLSLSGEGADPLLLTLQEADYSVHAGVVLRVFLGDHWMLQPEAILNSSRADYQLEDLTQVSNLIFEERYQYLDVPFLITYKTSGRRTYFRLMAGPIANFFLDSNEALTEAAGFEEEFDSFTLGWTGGVGLDFWKLMLDLRYEGTLERFGDHLRFGGQQIEFSQRPARLSLSLGYKFGR